MELRTVETVVKTFLASSVNCSYAHKSKPFADTAGLCIFVHYEACFFTKFTAQLEQYHCNPVTVGTLGSHFTNARATAQRGGTRCARDRSRQ